VQSTNNDIVDKDRMYERSPSGLASPSKLYRLFPLVVGTGGAAQSIVLTRLWAGQPRNWG
jgi:hypothetical protein